MAFAVASERLVTKRTAPVKLTDCFRREAEVRERPEKGTDFAGKLSLVAPSVRLCGTERSAFRKSRVSTIRSSVHDRPPLPRARGTGRLNYQHIVFMYKF
jgi:hypothetical protein